MLFTGRRLRKAELLHGHRRNPERIHFQPDDVVPEADEARRMVEGHEGRFAEDCLLGALVRALAERRVVGTARDVEERVDGRV